jgi:hypothetical protein
MRSVESRNRFEWVANGQVYTVTRKSGQYTHFDLNGADSFVRTQVFENWIAEGKLKPLGKAKQEVAIEKPKGGRATDGASRPNNPGGYEAHPAL